MRWAVHRPRLKPLLRPRPGDLFTIGQVTGRGKSGYRSRSMAATEPLHVRDALDKLVNQFSDPLSFLRELIQNALDAGSREVDVWVDFEAAGSTAQEGPEDRGVMTLRVEDWGEGMTREIIEKRLTRLFSSAKDGDRTKIGKFGIGFVSVFALEPDAVCIDTSREGQHWRILFDRDRNYSLIEREEPVEGTKVRVLLNATRTEADSIRTRAHDVVRYWCKHVRGEIHFQGELVSEKFGVDAPIVVDRPGEETALVVGHPIDPGQGIQGFYNRGLTLIEHRGGIVPGLAFKISSVKLEHTLTRDNVIEDAGYRSTLRSLRELAAGPLCDKTFEKLQAHVTQGAEPTRGIYLYRAAAWHAQDTNGVSARAKQCTVYMQPSGAAVSFEQLCEAAGQSRLVFASVRSPLTDALEATGEVVLMLPAPESAEDLVPNDEGALALLSALPGVVGERGKLVWLPQVLCQPQPPAGPTEVRDWNPLLRAVADLVKRHGGKLSGVVVGHFDYPESGIANRVAITQHALGEMSLVEDMHKLGSSLFSRRRMLVLNADHPAVIRCMELAQHEPEFSAYLLVKLFFLGTQLNPVVDAALAQHAMERRCRRST